MSIITDDDDVISLMDAKYSPTRGQTATQAELIAAVGLVLKGQSVFWQTLATPGGVECRYLSSEKGGGWKTGRARLVFEFVEDEPDALDVDAVEDSPALLEPATEDNPPENPTY